VKFWEHEWWDGMEPFLYGAAYGLILGAAAGLMIGHYFYAVVF
jgi:hypothetical protein